MSIPPSLDAGSQVSPFKVSPPTDEGSITIRPDDSIPASLDPSQSSATTGGGGSVVGRPRSYTREELAVGHAAESSHYYMVAKRQKAKDQRAWAELTEPPSQLFYRMSDKEYEQSIATNRAAALRNLARAKHFDPSLASVVDKMETGYQESRGDAWKALEELSAK